MIYQIPKNVDDNEDYDEEREEEGMLTQIDLIRFKDVVGMVWKSNHPNVQSIRIFEGIANPKSHKR